jgi:S-adenosylmethionine:tRNA ribosyltransferase-isomerase
LDRSAKFRCRLTSSAGQLPEDKERYQTVFAKTDGSVAAPTAGLHFTPELLEQIRARGVQICFVTLARRRGTFLPVKTETLADTKCTRNGLKSAKKPFAP